MTVAELLAQLQALPQDSDVIIEHVIEDLKEHYAKPLYRTEQDTWYYTKHWEEYLPTQSRIFNERRNVVILK